MRHLTAVVLAAAISACSAAQRQEAEPIKPRLLVLIAADQMSDDLLDRNGKDLTGGFHRLLTEGKRFTNALVDHAPTNSLPGHLSIASGAYPRRHGIVDNDWAEPGPGGADDVSGFGDPDCPVIGSAGAFTGDSAPMPLGPSRFEAPTIVEWARAASPEARFASVGIGGGVSALHAGKAKGPVLWYSGSKGEFVTSACYAEALPQWAAAFNATLKDRMAADWTLAAPAAMLSSLGPDASSYEHGGRDYVFPHHPPTDENERRDWFAMTPFADIAMLSLAKEAVRAEQLGADDVTDVLTIGISTLDHVGHRYGPTSVEQADTLWRIDQALGDFFAFLDETVGKNRWTVALTADHGSPPAPEDAARWGISGARRISETEVMAAIAKISAAADRETDPAARNAAAAEAARAIDFVERVITQEEIAAADGSSDPILQLYAHSYRKGRVSLHPLYMDSKGRSPAKYGLILVPPPYAVVDWAASIHGSPHPYDREVEMIFMGSGVAAGVDDAPARTIDVAPTLASLAGIKPTAEIDGQILPLRK